ncbi:MULTISPECIES: UdgX family uracil-DNA binding protein [unclassified Chelatococcus]|uniref:UdgX family uracil-DNA binding protein n=1 Tax=unclassified Chelatococcus TaxID=2638111 RepID=UPI001BCD32EB|nr:MULTISPECIES: UdgX family uracil-DNA binding protein [unclassified Chelatococcus]CAH1656530.1 putative Domain often clustered or fused with uracil-DNA glycosylase / Uracil-DNA glycosylase, family 6 [Hyphomicrobiales bacterium]MBS7742440.1 UdgX family uracil-DNA binding protein [Chelatococcus sp. HY11]MBX3542442.1 UdgX family uracil-DNA binding protein [Chelatococcus sp.]MCO5075341.1 UdgX family uracil-DNA binding protein [Chelatococcus sp.]CAH1695866.1 putative Domain often clustered or fus
MRAICLDAEDDFEGWRVAARSLAAIRIPAHEILWQVGGQPADLFGTVASPATATAPMAVPRDFVSLARQVILNRDPERFSLLYALLLRILDEPHSLQNRADRQLRRIEALHRSVRRDIHKMRAFVRFREVGEGKARRFVAWFEPEHHIVRANAAFFVERFTTMRWSILSPLGSIHWDGETLAEGPPAQRNQAMGDDPVEVVWKAYYSAIFNPARLMPNAMLKEMPKKYWKNMPETALIPGMIAGARERERGMLADARALPVKGYGAATIEGLREEARSCRRCPLWRPATQTVFGEGPHDARIMIIGEQPGDQEDQAGKAFVGPAGQVFDRALLAAGIDRASVYVTNAVKHFKFEPRGKRRIHARPNVGEIDACRWWVDQERAIVRPKLVIAMGATAARALTGRTMSVSSARGRPLILEDGTAAWITVHPSYLLRLPSEAEADEAFSQYVADLRGAVAKLEAA